MPRQPADGAALGPASQSWQRCLLHSNRSAERYAAGCWRPRDPIRAAARRLAVERRAGPPRDLFDVADRVTGAGNPTWLDNHGPAYADSPLVAALSAAGATLVGKVLTDELAFSLHGANVHYGTPLDTGR
jgi:hypothetical protein